MTATGRSSHLGCGTAITAASLTPQRTARYADLWNSQGGLATGEWEERQAALDAACAAVGRDPSTLERTAIVQVDLPGAGPRLAGMGPARVSGSPEELAQVFRGYAARGVAHLLVWLAPNSPAGVEAFAPVLQLLDQRA